MESTRRIALALAALLALAGCDEDGTADAGVDAGAGSDAGGEMDAGRDAGATDAGGAVDAGDVTDAGADVDGGADLDAGVVTDAGMVIDAGVVTDAGGMDAGGGDAGFDAGGVDAGFDAGAPPAPLHCSDGHLYIEEIDPGVDITVFNPTSAAINASVFFWCQRPAYPTLGPMAASIPPGGRAVLPWPVTFPDTDAGGELALYTTAAFGSPAAQIDFVCWGTGHAPSRILEARADGDWVGGCAPAITGGSLRRRPNTNGHSATSYDPLGLAAPLSCP